MEKFVFCFILLGLCAGVADVAAGVFNFDTFNPSSDHHLFEDFSDDVFFNEGNILKIDDEDVLDGADEDTAKMLSSLQMDLDLDIDMDMDMDMDGGKCPAGRRVTIDDFNATKFRLESTASNSVQVNVSTCLESASATFVRLINGIKLPSLPPPSNWEKKRYLLKQYILRNNVQFLTGHLKSLPSDQRQLVVQCNPITKIAKMLSVEHYYRKIFVPDCSAEAVARAESIWLDLSSTMERVKFKLVELTGTKFETIQDIVKEFDRINCKFYRGELESTNFALFTLHMGTIATTLANQHYHGTVYNHQLKHCGLVDLPPLVVPFGGSPLENDDDDLIFGGGGGGSGVGVGVVDDNDDVEVA